MQTEWWMCQFSNTHTCRVCSAIPHIFHYFLLYNVLISNSFTSVPPSSILSITKSTPLSCIGLTLKSHWFNFSPLSAVKFSLKLRFQPPPPPSSFLSWVVRVWLSASTGQSCVTIQHKCHHHHEMKGQKKKKTWPCVNELSPVNLAAI